MAVTTGHVQKLQVSRRMAKVTIRVTYHYGGLPTSVDHFFLIYNDKPSSVTIDPTEMVKRNWIMGALELALREHLSVAISHTTDVNAVVRAVTVQASE